MEHDSPEPILKASEFSPFPLTPPVRRPLASLRALVWGGMGASGPAARFLALAGAGRSGYSRSCSTR
jgi:hypothetical protein